MNDLIKYVPIKFCSYCGNDSDFDVIYDSQNHYSVKCQACGAHGPIANTNAGAILLWNAPANVILRVFSDLHKLEALYKESQKGVHQ